MYNNSNSDSINTCYQMGRKTRFKVIVFNQENFQSQHFRPRKGTENDVLSIKETFKNQNDIVYCFNNFKTEEIMAKLDESKITLF